MTHTPNDGGPPVMTLKEWLESPKEDMTRVQIIKRHVDMLSRIAEPDPALVDNVCARANAEQTSRRAAQMTKQNIRVVLKALAAELVT